MYREPQLDDVVTAHQRISYYIHQTPVLTCETLDRMTGAQIYFKCENFQKAGAFKFRGACNTVFSLSEEEAGRGVVTHSSGNHAGALSLAALNRGINAYIVMPSNAPRVKVEAVKNYGGNITFCQPTLESREETAEAVILETGATLVHPYNDYRIITGQGTAALELMRLVKDLDMILAPVGGGGLLSGTAITARSLKPDIQVIGCEPEEADDAYRSLKAGHIIPSDNPDTIADGLRTSLSEKTFGIIRIWVDFIVRVSETAILEAMRLIWERMKIVVEPSAAVPLAALISHVLPAEGKKVGVILSGGNVDLDILVRLAEGKRRND
jgi:threonine dehydratase